MIIGLTVSVDNCFDKEVFSHKKFEVIRGISHKPQIKNLQKDPDFYLIGTPGDELPLDYIIPDDLFSEQIGTEIMSGKNGFFNLFDQRKRRPSFNEVQMRQAVEWSMRSTCLRRRVGAVIVSEDNIFLSQGYNGAPRGSKHCRELGCERIEAGIPSGERQEKCRGVHAEQNALINALRSGRSVTGATMYCTTYPCSYCAKSIIQAGIKRYVYLGEYNDPTAEELLEDSSVEVESFSGVSPKAFPRIWE